MSDFPNQVQAIQSPAVAGDFCDANPRSTVDAGPNALQSGLGLGRGADRAGQHHRIEDLDVLEPHISTMS